VDLGRQPRGAAVTRTQRLIEQHRQGTAVVEVRDRDGRPRAGVAVWAEQEAHAFPFACAAPEWGALPEADRGRCAERMHEVFNRVIPAGGAAEPGAIRVDVPDGVDVGRFRVELDRLAPAGAPLEVRVRGRAVGVGADGGRAAADRGAALYTLCFAHPAVGAIVWDGLWDGEARAAGGGLLRLDGAPKTAFRYLHKLIGTVWHSRASGATDARGQFRFRGFFGDYRAAARVGDEPAITAVFAFRPGAPAVVLSLSGERAGPA
jgi:hypothetical protein